MLAEIYISALLVDEGLADQVWEAWDKGEIDDQVACTAWMMIAGRCVDRSGLWSSGRILPMVSSTHGTSDTPIDPGWYWYRARSHRAQMLRIDEHGRVDSPEGSTVLRPPI